MGDFNYLDSTLGVGIATSFVADTDYVDFVMVADRNKAIYLYAILDGGQIIHRIELSTGTLVGAISLPFSGEFGEEATGITYNRGYFILTMFDPVGFGGDFFRIWDAGSNVFLEDIVPDSFPFDAYRQLTFMRDKIWVVSAGASLDQVDPLTGNVTDTIALTGGNFYVGVTNDRVSLWLPEIVDVSIENWSTNGIRKQIIPSPGGATLVDGIAFNRIYKIYQSSAA